MQQTKQNQNKKNLQRGDKQCKKQAGRHKIRPLRRKGRKKTERPEGIDVWQVATLWHVRHAKVVYTRRHPTERFQLPILEPLYKRFVSFAPGSGGRGHTVRGYRVWVVVAVGSSVLCSKENSQNVWRICGASKCDVTVRYMLNVAMFTRSLKLLQNHKQIFIVQIKKDLYIRGWILVRYKTYVEMRKINIFIVPNVYD